MRAVGAVVSEMLAQAQVAQAQVAQTQVAQTQVDPDKVYAGPIGLLIMLLMIAATVFLIRNMNGRLKRLPRQFAEPGPAPEAGSDAGPVGPAGGAGTAGPAGPSTPGQDPRADGA